jgi:putative membrane protein
VADLASRWSVLAHLGSHLLLLLIAPPLLLLGLTDWMAAALTGPPPFDRLMVRLTRPFAATVLFNVAVIGAHLPRVMDATVRSSAVHAFVHAGLLVAATVMWATALRALPGARRLGPGGRIGFLALQSIVPNLPAAFLLLADKPLYPAYGENPRALGLSPLLDQQLGGAVVKIVAVGILAGTAAVVFFRWFASERRHEDVDRLTWLDVERELRRTERRTEHGTDRQADRRLRRTPPGDDRPE